MREFPSGDRRRKSEMKRKAASRDEQKGHVVREEKSVD